MVKHSKSFYQRLLVQQTAAACTCIGPEAVTVNGIYDCCYKNGNIYSLSAVECAFPALLRHTTLLCKIARDLSLWDTSVINEQRNSAKLIVDSFFVKEI
jgi:hypothetical protein